MTATDVLTDSYPCHPHLSAKLPIERRIAGQIFLRSCPTCAQPWRITVTSDGAGGRTYKWSERPRI